jgi:hypothetical protein
VINQIAGVVLVAFGGLLFVQLALDLTGKASETTSATPIAIPFSRRGGSLLGNPV